MKISCSRWFKIVFCVCWVIPLCDYDPYCVVFQVRCTTLYRVTDGSWTVFKKKSTR